MIINKLLAKSVKGQPEPVYGMGVTLLSYSDRHPGTIVDVEEMKNKVYITVQQDNAVRTDKNGMSESQEMNLHLIRMLQKLNLSWKKMERGNN